MRRQENESTATKALWALNKYDYSFVYFILHLSFTFPLCLQFHTEAYTLPGPEPDRLATRRHRQCSGFLIYGASPCSILYFIGHFIILEKGSKGISRDEFRGETEFLT